MADIQSIATSNLIWLPLVNAVMPSLVAIAVVWLTHKFSATRESRRVQADRADARKRLLREKLEQIVDEVDAHLNENHMFGMQIAVARHSPQKLSDFAATPTPIRAAALADLYFFPKLTLAMAEYGAGVAELNAFIAREWEAVAADPVLWKEQRGVDYVRRLLAAEERMHSARNRLVRAARELFAGDLAP